MSQNEPRRTEAANRLIEELMRAVLRQTPGATRVRLALVRATMGTPPLCDVVDTVVVKGRAIGLSPRNRPLSDWRLFLPALLAGQCTMQRLPRTLGVAGLRSRLPSSRLSSVLICPAAGSAGRIAGALFVLWDGNRPPPAAKYLCRPREAARRAADQIAEVLDLSGHGTFHICPRALVLEPAVTTGALRRYAA